MRQREGVGGGRETERRLWVQERERENYIELHRNSDHTDPGVQTRRSGPTYTKINWKEIKYGTPLSITNVSKETSILSNSLQYSW